MQALRVMAGFEKEDAYYLPRSRADPPDNLKELVWPWIEIALQYIEMDAEFIHPTAKQFLEFLQELRIVLLQDAAAFFISSTDDGRRLLHAVFDWNVFKSPLFLTFVEQMRVVLQEAEEPNDHAIEHVLPGLNCRLEALKQDFASGRGEMKQHVSETVELVKSELCATIDQLKEENAQQHHSILSKFRLFLSRGVEVFDDGRTGAGFVRRTSNRQQQYIFPHFGMTNNGNNNIVNTNNMDNPMDTHRNNNNVNTNNVNYPTNDGNNNTNRNSINNSNNSNRDIENNNHTNYSNNYLDDGHNMNDNNTNNNINLAENNNSNINNSRNNSANIIDAAELARVQGAQFSFRSSNTKRLNIIRMYKEYYGLAEFSGRPIGGGFAELEKKYKNKWRKDSYSKSDGVFFSRVKQLVVGLAVSSGTEEGVINDNLMGEAQEWQLVINERGISGCLSQLMRDGVLSKKGSRNRRGTNAGETNADAANDYEEREEAKEEEEV